MNATYNFILRNTKTNESVLVEAARSRSISWVLNRAGTCEFSVNITDEKLATINPNTRGIHELLVYRNSRLVWAGRVWSISDNVQGDTGEVTIVAKEILHVLSEKRFIDDVTYTSTDAGQIAWNMIDYTQSLSGGDLGITEGTIEATKNRDRTFLENEDESIGEEIIALTEVQDGFDFVITPTLQLNTQGVFNVFVKKGKELTDETLEYGEGTRGNITAFTRRRSLSDVGNSIKAFGDGIGNQMKISEQSDTTLISATTLLEKQVSFKSVKVQDTLDDHALEDLRISKVEQPVYDLTVSNKDNFLGRFDVGDSIRVMVNLGYLNVNTPMRIYAISLSVSDEGQEDITLTVSPIS